MDKIIRKRVETMRQLMGEKEVEAFIVINVEGSDRHNVNYLTGFSGTFGLLVLTLEELIFLTDSRYLERAKRELTDIKVKEINRKWPEEFAKFLNDLNIHRMGINSKTTSLYHFHQIKEGINSKTLVPLDGPVEIIRQVKDEKEIESIRKAVNLTDEAYQFLLRKVKPNMTEKEVAWELEKFMRAHGADGLAFSTIAASGPNSALPHHTTSDRKLKENDLMLLDFGAKAFDYCADMTRVFVIGEASKKQKEIYQVVLSAQENALKNIRSGMSSQEADKLARKVIEEAGFGNNFRHGLGHGLGLQIHESPRLGPDDDQKLKAGMVVTCEPGIYLPGWGGVRIEDLVVIEEEGCRNLTHSPKEELLSVPT